jgi:hypothetical protein
MLRQAQHERKILNHSKFVTERIFSHPQLMIYPTSLGANVSQRNQWI